MKLTQTTTIFFIFASTAFGQVNAGYIDYVKVQRSLPDYDKNILIIENLESNFNDSLLTMVKTLEKKKLAGDIDYTPKELKKNLDSIQKLQKLIEKFQKSAPENIASKHNELNNSVDEKISIAIGKFCELRNIEYLAKKTDLLYCSKCSDYTDELIDFMKSKE